MDGKLVVQLEAYDNREWTFDTERILHLFPESLLARAVELDPTAEVIPIPSRDVTPEGLDYLSLLIRENYPPVPSHSDIVSTGRYLGLDVMIVVSDPLYPAFIKQNKDINLLYIKTVSPELYREALEWALKFNYVSLCRYIFDQTDPLLHRHTDAVLLRQASFIGRALIVRMILARGIDPVDIMMDEQKPGDDMSYVVITADDLIRVGNGESYPYLGFLESGYINLDHLPLFLSAYAGHQSVVEVLLARGSIDPDDLQSAFQAAIMGDQLELIQWFIWNAVLPDLAMQEAFQAAIKFQSMTTLTTFKWILTNVVPIRSLDMNEFITGSSRRYSTGYDLNLVEAIVSDPELLTTLDSRSFFDIRKSAQDNHRPGLLKYL